MLGKRKSKKSQPGRVDARPFFGGFFRPLVTEKSLHHSWVQTRWREYQTGAWMDSQLANGWHSSEPGLARKSGQFPGNMGGRVPPQPCTPATGFWIQPREWAQDGKDMGEFGEDGRRQIFGWVVLAWGCVWGDVVVQMEDDTNKDVDIIPSEGWAVCCRP